MRLAKAIVLKDCEPEPDGPPGQLALKKNDILEIVQMNDQRNGWLMGTKLGEGGPAREIKPDCVGLFIEPKYIQQLEIEFARLKEIVENLQRFSDHDNQMIHNIEDEMDQLQPDIFHDIPEDVDIFHDMPALASPEGDRPEEPHHAQDGGKKKKNMSKSNKRKSRKRKSHKHKNTKRRRR
tara:strand:+ start:81 stop:620 length:540 start_codon:yes stop_codon:yes gene_type:complete